MRVGPFTLHASKRQLLCSGARVPLGPRTFDLLCALAQRAGSLVSKDELLDAVWPGRDIEETNLHVQASKLRKVLGPDALITVAGRGYRLALPVRAADPSPAAEAVNPTRPLSIVVLPFVEPVAPPAQAYFADAVTDDVTTQLARIKGSFVIASSTALALRGETLSLAACARELGVRYVLQGRIERGRGRLELNARLSDAQTLAVLWSGDFTVGAADLRTLRRELVARLAASLDLELVHAAGGPEPDRRDGRVQAALPDAVPRRGPVHRDHARLPGTGGLAAVDRNGAGGLDSIIDPERPVHDSNGVPAQDRPAPVRTETAAPRGRTLECQ
ncbi:MAG TPA: winged helix-turn-helix domain-containing protein [Zeimonas sp.]|nr:winged helix-turn-helix domain-containing protein [Zeimonas sp.]